MLLAIAGRRVAGVALFGIRLSGLLCVLPLGLSVGASGAVQALDPRHSGAKASLFCTPPVVAGSASSAQDAGYTPRAGCGGAAVL